MQGLDHVALAVSDQEVSERFYHDVLGLERVYADAWGKVPIMMVAQASGVALFQAKPGPEGTPAIRILHVAFRVDRANFETAQTALAERGISFDFQDHDVSHSIYFGDPDGHRLELTTYDV